MCKAYFLFKIPLDFSCMSIYYEGRFFYFFIIIKHSNIGRNTDMKTVKISLNSIDKVKSFVNDLTKFDTDFDLVSGRYVIDAKSIMGIFSLDLSKPIDLNIHDGGNTEEILTVLAPYIIEA